MRQHPFLVVVFLSSYSLLLLTTTLPGAVLAQTQFDILDTSSSSSSASNNNNHAEERGGILRYTRELEAYRKSSSNWPRKFHENVDVINDTALALEADDDPLQLRGKAICHLVEMNRYSMAVGPAGTKINFPSTYPLESLAAVVLATQHLNTGDGSVIPQIAGLNDRCPIRFTSEFLDTEGVENVAVDQVINVIQRTQSSPAQQQSPCAFLGAFRGQVNIATALYTSLKGYPQVSTLTSTPELDNKDIYPLYGSLNPSNAAKPFLEFLIHVVGINHLAVVHSDNPRQLNWVNPLRETAAKYFPNFHITTVGYSQGQKTDFVNTVSILKQTGIRYIYSIADTTEYEGLIREAHRQGIAGVPTSHNDNDDDEEGQEDEESQGLTYTWITWVGIAQTFLLNKEFTIGDPILETARNMLLIDSTIRSIPGIGRYNEYLTSRQQLAKHPDDVAFLESKVPQHPNEPGYNPSFPPEVVADIGRFSGTAAVLYDATIALGLGACAAAKVYNSGSYDDTGSNPKNTFDGATHYEGFLNVSFVGASGLVELDPTTGSRDATSNVYAMFNMIPIPVPETPQNFTYSEVKTHYYDQGKWIEVTPIQYIDGSEIPHPDLPPTQVETNSIGTSLRCVGLALGGLVLLTSMGCSIWTIVNRSNRIVRASQPVFLLLITFGTFLMGTAIIPLSLDDEVLQNEQHMDAACMSVPWLLALGFCFTFSALFSKTRRVNIIFHNPNFRRVQVNAVDVVRPMLILLVLNIVLLGVWSGVSPLEWNREVVAVDTFGRPNESVGKCGSDHLAWFVIPLLVINLGALIYAIHQAYAARKISTEFAESEWIFRAMSFIMLVSFVTIPVIVIAEEDIRASYFVECALVFVICMSVLGFIFGPKVWAAMTNKTVTQESIKKSLERRNTTTTTSYIADDISVSGRSSYEGGALILEHPKTNQDMKEELKELKKLKKEWEMERAASARQLQPESVQSNDFNVTSSTGDSVSALGNGSSGMLPLDSDEEEE